MALTDYDKKYLNKTQQQQVQAATDKWNAANANGDTAGMAAAAAEAAAVRNSAGYTTDSSGNYTGSIKPTTSGSSGGSSYSGSSGGVSSGGGSTNNQYTNYTPTGSYNDSGLPSWAESQINYLKELYTASMANGNVDAANKAHADAEAIRKQYGYSGGDDEDNNDLLLKELEGKDNRNAKYVCTMASSRVV